MKLGILSDTHNNLDNAVAARDALITAGVQQFLHCGDVTTPKIAKVFREVPIAFVMGNMDGDAGTIRELIADWDTASMSITVTAEFAGKSIAMCHGHYQNVLAQFIHSGEYDYVFHGHSHVRRDERVGITRVINPGALGGRKPQTRSFCILDLATDELSVVELSE